MNNTARPLSSIKNDKELKGEFIVDGDKSISHRALIFSSLANGVSEIDGLLEGEDVLRTAKAMELMGVKIERNDKNWKVFGSGYCGLIEPTDVIDMGNSGTAARLLAGLVSTYNFTSFFTGDKSLRRRPMKRVFDPINKIGAKIISRKDNLMPFAVIGTQDPIAIEHEMKVASAQVKSSILLASLNISGTTTVIEPIKTRNHTELMMQSLGLKIDVKDIKSGSIINYTGMQGFDGKNFTIPGDISSAAFFIVGALIVKNSKIKINNVGINPLRDGVIKTLIEMGGNIKILNERLISNELVADIEVESSKLKGINIPANRAPSMIDEYPILSIAAAHAEGITNMNGLEELKVKESNRFNMIIDNLTRCGVEVKNDETNIKIMGGVKQPANIVDINTSMDHRIAMSFLIMGLTLENGIKIDDSSMIATSFPSFEPIFSKLGIKFKEL